MSISWYLYYPREKELMNGVTLVFERLPGYYVELRPPHHPIEQWLLKVILPPNSPLTDERVVEASLRRICRVTGGEYDGWEMQMED